MANVEGLRLRKPTPGPEKETTPKAALQGNPESVVVIATYKTERSVREAANRINMGRRAEWPPDVYYGAWSFDDASGRWEMWIGLRSHMPEGWRKFVEGRPTARRRPRAVRPEGEAAS